MSTLPNHKMDLNLPSQIPIDAGYEESRENLLDDESALSIASTAHSTTTEYGRTYLDYHSKRHVFPSSHMDKESELNELIFNDMVLTILDNKYFVAPVHGEELRNVLDLATGLGLWPENVADTYPDCEVVAMDSFLNTTTIPNLTFQRSEIEEEWIFDKPVSFDLVHMRNLFGCLPKREFPGVYKQAFQ